jgi:hypothetical protein
MANITRTLADTAGFIPQSWANEALKVLRQNIVLAKIVARDSDFTQAGWKGKTLNIPFPGTFAATAKTPGSLATVATPSNGNSVNVTLSNHQTVDFILEDLAFDSAQNGISMMEAYGQAAGVALAEQLETDLMALVSSLTNDSIRGTIGSNINYAAVVAARKQLVDNKAPMSDRALILSTKDYAAALSDSSLLPYFQYNSSQNNSDVLAQGVAARLLGMDVYESQFVKQISGGHAVQSLTPGTQTGGTFTLTYNSVVSAAIPWNATAAQVEAALAAVSTIGAGNVRCSGGPMPGSAVIVELFLASPLALTAQIGSLTGGTPAMTVADSTLTATNNIALHKNALLLAVRPMTAPTSAGVEVAYAVDDMSGIGLRVQMQYQPQYRGVYVAYDVLYGVAAIRPNQASVILA